MKIVQIQEHLKYVFREPPFFSDILHSSPKSTQSSQEFFQTNFERLIFESGTWLMCRRHQACYYISARCDIKQKMGVGAGTVKHVWMELGRCSLHQRKGREGNVEEQIKPTSKPNSQFLLTSAHFFIFLPPCNFGFRCKKISSSNVKYKRKSTLRLQYVKIQ